jgi:hypothetical protein
MVKSSAVRYFAIWKMAKFMLPPMRTVAMLDGLRGFRYPLVVKME